MCLEFEPRSAEWKAPKKPLTYGGPPKLSGQTNLDSNFG